MIPKNKYKVYFGFFQGGGHLNNVQVPREKNNHTSFRRALLPFPSRTVFSTKLFPLEVLGTTGKPYRCFLYL